MIKFQDPYQQYMASVLVKRMLFFIMHRLEDDTLLSLSMNEFKDHYPQIEEKINITIVFITINLL